MLMLSGPSGYRLQATVCIVNSIVVINAFNYKPFFSKLTDQILIKLRQGGRESEVSAHHFFLDALASSVFFGDKRKTQKNRVVRPGLERTTVSFAIRRLTLCHAKGATRKVTWRLVGCFGKIKYNIMRSLTFFLKHPCWRSGFLGHWPRLKASNCSEFGQS